MIKNQRDQFDMLLGIEHHFNTNTTAWINNSLLVNVKTKLSDDIKTLWALQSTTFGKQKSDAIDKADKRKTLEKQCLIIAVRVQAYFAILQKAEQLHSVQISKSKLRRSKDAALLGICYTLHTIVNTVINNLAPYQITPSLLADFMIAINEFNALINAPAEAQITRVANNKKHTILLRDTLLFVKNIVDNIVSTIVDTQDHFVGVYKNMRKIYGSPTHRRSLSTTCVDDATGLPLAGILLKIKSTKLLRISKAKGKNYFQNVKAGEWLIVANGDGYITQEVACVVVANGMTVVVVRMVRRVK
jgi:hypothetical protein